MTARSAVRTLAAGLLASALACTTVAAQDRQNTLGTWHGALDTPMGKLTLIVRLDRSSTDTTLTGSMESIDQAPGQRIPLAQVSATPARIAFNIPAIGASYEGSWDAAAESFVGAYKQGGTIPFALKRGLPPARAVVDGMDGRWRALLPRGDAKLRLILNVRTTPETGTRVTLDSPDLTAFGLPVDGFERSSAQDSVRFTLPSTGVTFRGVLAPDGRTLRGSWLRAGQPDATVEFTRDSATRTARARSQWPLTDVTYRAEEVRFVNASATGVTLAGTLTIPAGTGPFPAAVLISGSGAQDRDETLFGHKPFAVLAHDLTKRGIAVLRFDDRGFAASTGDHAAATSADFATDVRAAVEYLRKRPEIDRAKIGLIGHSEGGLIGPIAAAEDKSGAIAYLVMLAGPGTNTVRIALSQRRLIGISQGVTEAQLDRSEPLVVGILEEVRATKDTMLLKERLRARLTPEALQAIGADASNREAMVVQYSAPWMRFFLHYDPATYLSRVKIPILAINGSLDKQVPAMENLAGLRVILAKHKDATVTELPGLNHFFQTATTGAMGEYADIAETFAPGAMDVVGGWILGRFP